MKFLDMKNKKKYLILSTGIILSIICYFIFDAISFICVFPLYSLIITCYLISEELNNDNFFASKITSVFFLLYSCIFFYLSLCINIDLTVLILLYIVLILMVSLNIFNLIKMKKKQSIEKNSVNDPKTPYILFIFIPILFFLLSFGKEIMAIQKSDFGLTIEDGEWMNHRTTMYAIGKKGCMRYTIHMDKFINIPFINNDFFKLKGIGEATFTTYDIDVLDNQIKIIDDDKNFNSDYHNQIISNVKNYLSKHNKNGKLTVEVNEEMNYYLINDEKIVIYKDNKFICEINN